MSSPPRYRKTFSPIRNLDERLSPTRNLDTILQEPFSAKVSPKQSLDNQRTYNNKYFTSKYNDNYIDQFSDTKNILIQNQRLKSDNQILANSRKFAVGNYTKQLYLKQQQSEDLRRQINLIQDKYQRENLSLRLQNQSLKKTLVLLENKKAQQFAFLKLKYTQIPEVEVQQLRKNYNDDISKVLMDLETTRMLLNEKQRQLTHLSMICNQNSAQYGANLESLISDNNVLKNQIIQLEMSTEKQIRQMSARKELQKSRTQGIISYCKENTLYIEKQINRLADELLKKNISIQAFSREVTKYQRLIEEQGRRNDDQVFRMKRQFEQKLNENENSFNRIEKQFKQDLAEKKKIQLQLLDKISSMQNEIEVLNKKLDYSNQVIHDKEKVVKDLKQSILRKEEDHAKQISKVMSESKIKRRSMKNISSSYSSFKDIQQAQGSSIIKSGNIRRTQSIVDQATSPLPIVRQEQNYNLAQSHNFPGPEDQLDIKQLVLHYESMIQQLKRNKITELSIANNKIQTLKNSLNQKQQQVLDILNRFSPLMEYNISHQSIDEERRRKIEQHQKGDIDLLSVMLSKYDIVSLRTSRK